MHSSLPPQPDLDRLSSGIQPQPILRMNSRDVLRHAREIEIDHEGRIYRLRITQLNKLILTA